jgi:myosin heavy subunit
VSYRVCVSVCARVFPLQSAGERNYHIFYYLVHGADEAQLRKLGLSRSVTYRYLRDDGAEPMSGEQARAHLDAVRHAMQLFEFEPAHKACAFAIIAAVLLVGQVMISER